MTDVVELNAITDAIIGAAIKIHQKFGPGLLHSVYLPCLAHDLVRAGLNVEMEKPIPLEYGDVKTACAYRIDMMIDGQIIVELKCIDRFAPVHRAQMLTYLRLTECPVGLLINFNVTVLTDGIRRVVNNLRDDQGNLALFLVLGVCDRFNTEDADALQGNQTG
jgi:GxxExxY protein